MDYIEDLKYIYDYKLTYKKECQEEEYNVNNDNDDDDDDDDDKYQNDLLNVFNNLKEYDPVIIDKIILNVYQIFMKNDRMKNILKIIANQQMSEELDLGCVLLFSYDYFYLTHQFLKTYFIENIYDENIIIKLEKKIIK
jgi:hypothetical protein